MMPYFIGSMAYGDSYIQSAAICAGRSRCEGRELRQASSRIATCASNKGWPDRAKLSFEPPVSPITAHAAPA